MAIRGQRFHIDLESDEDKIDGRSAARASSPAPGLPFVRDITERRKIDSARPPSPPTLKASENGFPAHRKRSRLSASQQQQAASPKVQSGRNLASDSRHDRVGNTGLSSSRGSQTSARSERQIIDQENKQRMAQMSSEEIESERAELMAGMSSSLIERLLKRANIDEGRTDMIDRPAFSQEEELQPPAAERAPSKKNTSKKVTFAASEIGQSTLDQPQTKPAFDPDAPPSEPREDLHGTRSHTPLQPAPSVHFPHPPEAPSLDPSDPDFLENLHSRYFPDFPVDPSKLAWMSPIPTEGSPADYDSPYNPSHPALPVSSIRFDFRGRLIPPLLARQLPVTKGLHHHGRAPEAAGYTVPELAHLARSSVPAQRCIAYQTLGRILYRLGRGDFGDASDELDLGLWKCLEEGRVVDTLTAEATQEDGVGHRSGKVMATEALWLWRKGGGKKVKAQ